MKTLIKIGIGMLIGYALATVTPAELLFSIGTLIEWLGDSLGAVLHWLLQR